MANVTASTFKIIQSYGGLKEAYFECDSSNNVILKELESLKGRNMKPVIKYKEGRLQIKTIHDTVFIDRKVEISKQTQYNKNNTINKQSKIDKTKKRGFNLIHALIAFIVGFLLHRPIVLLFKVVFKALLGA